MLDSMSVVELRSVIRCDIFKLVLASWILIVNFMVVILIKVFLEVINRLIDLPILTTDLAIGDWLTAVDPGILRLLYVLKMIFTLSL